MPESQPEYKATQSFFFFFNLVLYQKTVEFVKNMSSNVVFWLLIVLRFLPHFFEFNKLKVFVFILM